MSKRLAISCLLWAMLASTGCTQEKKPSSAAVINTREVLTKCNAGIQVSQDIQHEFAEQQNALKKQEDAIQKLQNDPQLSDPKSGKKEELQRLMKIYVDANQQFRRDVGNAEAARFQPVVDKVNKALAEYAKTHGLVSIQDKTGFAYVDSSIDITEAIIKQVDQAR